MLSLKNCMVIIMAIFVTVQTSEGAPLERWRVKVTNEMTNGESLFLHCKSKDNDLGQRNLTVGQDFTWKFRQNLWQTTLFWCYMSNKNSHVTMEVFWPESQSKSWIAKRCGDHMCSWSAKDDGIYIFNAHENRSDLHTKWLPGW